MTASADRSGTELHPKTSSLTRMAKGANSANDSLEQKGSQINGHPTKRVYVTRVRVAAVASRMGEQHWAILGDVGRLKVVTGKQIRRLHHDPSQAGARLARKKLAQLSSWHVLTRLDRQLPGWGNVYSVGVVGQRLLHPEWTRYRPPWTPRPSYLSHALAVTDLYVALREQEHSGRIELAAFDTEPVCWRPSYGPGGARLILKPDALAVVQFDEFEDRHFIEADCDTESGPRISAKARAYVRYWQSGREQAENGVFPYVLWVTTTETRKRFLIDTLARLPAEHWRLFMVATADEAAERISTGTTVSINNRKGVNQ
jgi:hypothetical protein